MPFQCIHVSGPTTIHFVSTCFSVVPFHHSFILYIASQRPIYSYDRVSLNTILLSLHPWLSDCVCVCFGINEEELLTHSISTSSRKHFGHRCVVLAPTPNPPSHSVPYVKPHISSLICNYWLCSIRIRAPAWSHSLNPRSDTFLNGTSVPSKIKRQTQTK